MTIASVSEVEQALDHDHCFLCGANFEDVERTDEHVFAQWLLREFDLWNEHLNLLNGTSIPYRSLTIPCCKECNSTHLSTIEDRVATAYRAGFDAFGDLDQTTLFLFLAKMYYGILFKELSLLADRADSTEGTIITPGFLELFETHHLLLQAARGAVTWSDFPASILLFRAQVDATHAKENFDFFDSVRVPFLTLRLGAVFVVAFLQDWGAAIGSGVADNPVFEAARTLELHPLQTGEITAYAGYIASQFNRNPTLLIGKRDGVTEIYLAPLGGMSSKPVFDPFDLDDYHAVLIEVMTRYGFDLAPMLEGQTGVWTWVCDKDGEPQHIPR